MNGNFGSDQVAGDESGTLARLTRWAKTAIADAWERHALRQELAADATMNRELELILAEAGLTRGEVETLIKGYPEGPRLLRAMTKRLGIAEEYRKDPLIQRDIERTCLLCTEHKRCRHWLQTAREDGYRDFCPNTASLDFLRRRMATRAAAAG